MRLIGKLPAALFLLAAATAFGDAALAKTPAADFDRLVQEAAQDVMQQYGVPGLAIAISANGQQRFYNYGLASKATRQPVTRDTLFEVGSISKTFTATLATYAQATGHLSLDASPGHYLTQLQGSALDKVTLLNLGTHTAGGFPLQLPDSVQDTEQLLDYFKTWQPHYAPGTHRTYANPSIGLLGMIAAQRLQVPYETAMEQQLFPKLGMPNSFIDIPASKQPLYAQGYNKQDTPVRVSPGVLAAEAYGVKTSSRDLIRFIDANMRLAPIDATLQRALKDTHIGYYSAGPMTQDLIWEQYAYPVALETLLEGNSDKMAFETNVATELNPPLPPQDAVWINKTGATNGFGAYVAFIPAQKRGIVLLANKNYPNEARIQLAYRILKALD